MLTEQFIEMRVCNIPSSSFSVRSDTGECTGGYNYPNGSKRRKIRRRMCVKRKESNHLLHSFEALDE